MAALGEGGPAVGSSRLNTRVLCGGMQLSARYTADRDEQVAREQSAIDLEVVEKMLASSSSWRRWLGVKCYREPLIKMLDSLHPMARKSGRRPAPEVR